MLTLSTFSRLLCSVSVLAIPCLTMSPVALAQDVSARPVETAPNDTIIVTGTRQAQRTVYDSLAPIDVISETAIQGTVSEDLLDTIAQIVPSFKVQRLPLADGLIFVRPATLRGLSPDHTLVLVNGKRRHRSALLGRNGAQSPDLATVPSFAIKRIEVLRDGASAQYGSDAIAGVINILLDDTPGFSTFAQVGQYFEGDGTNYQIGGQAGFDLGNKGFFGITAEYYDADRTSRSRQRADAIAFQAANPTINVADPVQNWGQPEREAYRFAVNTNLSLSDAAEIYGFGTFATGEGVSDFNWRRPGTGVFGQSNAFPDFDLNTIYPAGFAPQFGQEDKDVSLTGGLRGEVFDGSFGWDISGSIGENEIDYIIDNTINASLGPNSPTAFRPGILRQSEANLNADFVYRADFGWEEPLNIAFGAERREESYEIAMGDPASFAIGPGAPDGLPTGSNGFRGFGPQQAGTFDQESYAAYIDLETRPTPRWTVGGALRFEDFSQFGDTLNGKLSTRYELTPSLALRATASTGFRAPTPAQLFSESTSQGLDTQTLEVFTAGRFSPEGDVADILAQRQGVTLQSLQPEEATNMTVGLAFQNDHGFNATIDAYLIDIEDRFGSSPRFVLTDEERAGLTAAGVPGANTFTRVNFFQNDFDTQTFGLDMVAGYRVDLGEGNLSLNVAYNYNKTEVEDGSFLNNERNRVLFEERLPEHTANLSANYDWGAFGMMGRVRYYGPWTDASGNADGDIFQRFGSEVFLDAALTWRMTDSVRVRAGAENLFDNYPDEATFQANRGLIYSRNAPYDTDGGRYYVRFDADF